METKICARSAKSHFLTTGFFRTFSVLLCFLTIAAAASADVILTDRAAQSVAGQNFTFTFTPVQPSDGSDGTFTIRARGDYGTGVASEYLTWDIDGIMSDTSSPYYGATVLHSYNSNDVEWQQAFVVSGADLVAMTSDSVITITVDLSSAVDYQIDPARHYVEVTLAYNSGSGGCLLPPAPSGPVPADGAIDVPVDTNLAWNSAGGGGDHIVINELFMHSGDWLELFNPTGSSVNLTGWQVIARRNTDTTTFILPAFVLVPVPTSCCTRRRGLTLLPTSTSVCRFRGPNLREAVPCLMHRAPAWILFAGPIAPVRRTRAICRPLGRTGRATTPEHPPTKAGTPWLATG